MQIFLFGLSFVLILAVFIPYIIKIYRDQLSPHSFSWLIWATSSLITFFGQLHENAGMSSYTTLQIAVSSYLVVLCSLKNYSSQRITKRDWFILFLCLIILGVWQLAQDPVYAILLSVGATIFAYIPIIAKTYIEPHKDQMHVYGFLCLVYAVNIFLLENRNLITLLFPVTALTVNSVLIYIIAYRRRLVAA